MKSSHRFSSPFYLNRPLSNICQIFHFILLLSYHKRNGNSREKGIFPLQGSIYHGHVVSWKGLNEQVKKALEKAGLVNSHGKVLVR
ncbi:MAG: hypothetical protein M1169_02040 [Firmicutes bacterium]|nr:hypothetical protein [Bacillota bacterium]